jgi:Rps23 Pro-64 3,4-dihydroxylase Tpa1-like proline 4-hydroxylase
MEDGPLDLPGRHVMNEFFDFALGEDGLRAWLGAWIGVALGERFTCEVVRYSSGDFIAEHTDAYDGRVVGVTLYLDPDWTDVAGGQLLFSAARRLEPACAPRFNTLALIPIAASCSHAVSPWTAPSPGRHGISLAYHPMRAGQS